MEGHSGLEISIAEAGKEDQTLQLEAEAENRPQGIQDELNEDGPIEFTTPPETSQFEVVEEGQVGVKEAGDVIEEHQDATEEIQETCPAPQVFLDRPASPELADESFDVRVTETPIPTRGQKRKRKVQISDPVEHAPEPRKRRKEIVMSSSTLLPSSESSTTNLEVQQVTDKIVPELQPRRQSSIEGWAQPYKPGLKLRHPIFNPKPSPKRTEHLVEVLIPRTSQAGPSSKAQMKDTRRENVIRNQRDEASDGEDVNAQFSSTAVRSSTYTTTNGKARAEAGIEYSTPSKTSARRGLSQKSSGIATSVAKRTFPSTPADKVNGDSGSEYSGDNAAFSGEEISDTELTLRNIMDNNFECGTCHAKFKSEKALKRHLKSPYVHMLKCRSCSKKFVSRAALEKHESESGHGEGHGGKGAAQKGQVGAFDTHEVQKLNNWKGRFCDDHNITGAQFNDMMTATMQKGREGTWTWAFITRIDFMDQYLSVLPYRNRTSMLRYRERHFQNLEGSLNWTEEDDIELIRLVKEMGTKWSKIAKVMMRTQDAVSQRWRHKLQYTKIETGEWTKAENAKLRKVVNEIRRQSGVTADTQEWSVPWVHVSEKMKTRTTQQCSNHWRALHGTKKDGRWVPLSALEKTPGASRILTPSKMQTRLEGAEPNFGKRSALSSKYVKDDDTDQENMSEEPDSPDMEDVNSSKPTESESIAEASDNETTKTPHVSTMLLTKKTPGKTIGSSQLFAQTQLNTSALKPPPSNTKRNALSQSHSQPQDRPSPNISIQRRAISRSPLQELTLLPDVGLDREDDCTGAEGSEDDVNNDVEVENSDAENEVMTDGSGLEDDSSSEGSESDVNEKHEAEEISEDGSDDEEDSDENTNKESEGADEEQSSVNNETFDFMNSINEAAQRVKNGQTKFTNGRALGPRKRAKPLEDESEDEETDGE